MFADESFIDRLIDNQRHAVKSYRFFAIAVFVLGASVILLALVWPGQALNERLKTLLTIGGGVVSSLSGFQLKEILSRRDKIAVLETMKNQVSRLKAGSENAADRSSIEAMLGKIVEKMMG